MEEGALVRPGRPARLGAGSPDSACRPTAQFPHEPGHVAQVTTEDDRVYGFVGLHTIRAQVRPQAPAWPAVLGQHAERFAGQEVW